MFPAVCFTAALLSAQNASPLPAPGIPVPEAGDPLFAPVATTAVESTHERLVDYMLVTFGPRALVGPALGAGIRMLNPPANYPRDWKDGAGAFGRNYGDHLARSGAMETTRFLTGAILHEDFRYRPSKSTNGFARAFHAVGYTLVDKTDSGHSTLALANLAGAAADGFVGNLYLPAGYNNPSHAGTRSAITLGSFAARNLTREFAPEILHTARRLHLPFPRVPVPGWWVPRK